MLTEISVSGFKSIESLSESLRLGRVNVFIGSNGSGKSNVLEAIGVLGAAAGGRVDDEALLARGVRPGTPALFKTAFSGPRIPRAISLSARAVIDNRDASYIVTLDNPVRAPAKAWQYVTESLQVDGVRVLGRNPRGTRIGEKQFTSSEYSGLAEVAAGLEGKTVAAQLISDLRTFAIYSPNTPALRGTVPDPGQRDPIGLAGGRLPEAVSQLLDKDGFHFGRVEKDDIYELLDWVSDIDIVPPSRQILASTVPSMSRVVRFTDRFMRESRNQLTGYDASEGALYVLFLLVIALHPNCPRFLAIDNFDQALNPRLARELMRVFTRLVLEANEPKQVVLTTHNPVVLDGLDIRNDDVRLFVAQRTSHGATQLRRVHVTDRIVQDVDKGMTLSNLWVMGRLGGVPDV